MRAVGCSAPTVPDRFLVDHDAGCYHQHDVTVIHGDESHRGPSVDQQRELLVEVPGTHVVEWPVKNEEQRYSVGYLAAPHRPKVVTKFLDWGNGPLTLTPLVLFAER